MDRPHCNNSNNIRVHGTGAELHNHSPQMPDKNRCNGSTENGCFSFDGGYSSFQSENSEPNHSLCNSKSEQHTGQFQMPGSTPNGTLFMEHYQPVDPMQTPLQNGHIYPQEPLRYSGHNGPMHFSYSGEAVDEYQIPASTCIPNRPPLTPNSSSQDGYQSRMQNGPTSPRPPPVIRKHSSFLRQNAIEEEDDDNTDELNDSGFGSMCRTTSWEKPRRSRSKDVSDAAADDVNNNLAPRKLQRSQSSQEKTDNELAQYTDKRRCSSEQILQRSDRSSGYFSVDSIQGVPTGDGSKPDDLAGAEAKASAEDNDDIILSFRGLKDTLNACRTDVWKVEELLEEISSDPAVLQLDASEVHCQLMKKLSIEIFISVSHFGQPSTFLTSDMGGHSTQAIGHLHLHVDDPVQELKSTTSRPEGEEDPSKHIPKDSKELEISRPESVDDQQGSDDTKNATKQVPEIKVSMAPLHGDTLDQATKDNLQKLLEKRAYCQAMEHDYCSDLECLKTIGYQNKFKECWSNGSLDKCSDCKETVKAYWNHSLGCHSDRCMLPFCCYFKELCSETGALHEPAIRIFEGALGYLVTEREIKVLKELHELEQLQYPAADDEIAWSANINAESYLRKGQPGCHLTPLGRLCKFGRFTPIRCRATKQNVEAKNSIVIKKTSIRLRHCQSLISTLQLLHKTQPILGDHISTCLWYRQINEKLLICSTYLSEKNLSSCLQLSHDTLEEYWIKACDAAVKLHESRILYLNWKVDHVVVTHEDGVKLCNLDYAVAIDSSNRDLRGSCSEEWREDEVPEHVKTGLDPRIAPPEVLDGRRLSRESDSWGLGCLLYQLYNEGRLPYHDLSHCSDDEIRQKRKTEDHSTLVPASPKIMFLTETCWKKDRMDRPLPGKLIGCLDRWYKFSKLWSKKGGEGGG